MKRYIKLAFMKLAAVFGLHVILAANEEDRKCILEAAEFQPNDVY